MARFVRGPMATIVIVSGSFSRNRRNISSLECFFDGVKRPSSLEISSARACSSGSFEDCDRSKRCFHVSAGVICGCVSWIPARPSLPSRMLSAHGSRCQGKRPHTKEVCHDSLVLSGRIECEQNFRPDRRSVLTANGFSGPTATTGLVFRSVSKPGACP